MLLRHDCDVYCFHVKAYCAQPEDAGSRFLSLWHFAKKENIWYFYWSFVYLDGMTQFNCHQIWEEVVIGLTEIYFKKYALLLDVDVESSRKDAQKVWMFAENSAVCDDVMTNAIWSAKNHLCHTTSLRDLQLLSAMKNWQHVWMYLVLPQYCWGLLGTSDWVENYL